MSYHGWAHPAGRQRLAIQRHVGNVSVADKGADRGLDTCPFPWCPLLFWGHLLTRTVAHPQAGTCLQPCLPAPPAWGPSARSRGGLAHRQFSPENKWREIALTGEQPLFQANFHIIESNCFPFPPLSPLHNLTNCKRGLIPGLNTDADSSR